MATQFDPDTIAGVCGYMNAEGMRQNLVEILKRQLGDETLSDAEMVGFDSLGFDAVASGASGTASVRVPWPNEALDRGEVRTQLMALYERAIFG